MIQLKLTLKSNRPSVVYAINGKSYRLQPGSNTLNLEYDDYVALATALSIKPVANKEADKKEPAPVAKPIDDVKPSEPINELEQPIDPEHIEDEKPEDIVNESKQELEPTEESNDEVKEAKEINDTSETNYSEWSYSDLKAKYKEITGKSCKLKKDEIISFLQEHSTDVE